jgi:hypothetical protein
MFELTHSEFFSRTRFAMVRNKKSYLFHQFVILYSLSFCEIQDGDEVMNLIVLYFNILEGNSLRLLLSTSYLSRNRLIQEMLFCTNI